MLRKYTLTLFLALALSTAVGSTAHAGPKSCPVLVAGKGDICDCIVHNYGKTLDTGVTIKLVGGGNGAVVSTPLDLSEDDTRNEAVTITNLFAQCGCRVTGAARDTSVSLSVSGGIGQTPKVAVPCN